MSRRALWVGGILLALILATLVAEQVLQSAIQTRRSVPILGELPSFELTERSGKSFGTAELKGKVWLADFIFTSCSGPCPAMTQKLSQMQNLVEGREDSRLVTFSVDPEHDTPAVLRTYADQFKAHPQKWLFLTGPFDTVRKLVQESFRLTMQKNVGAPSNEAILHSTHFILVDRQGRLRGYYDSSDPKAMASIPDHMALLLKEKIP